MMKAILYVFLEKIIANAMLIIHFQEGINWMNIIYADYSIYHNSIDICTYAGYILRIAMKWQSAFKKNHLEKYEWNITDMRGKIGKEIIRIYHIKEVANEIHTFTRNGSKCFKLG